MESPASSRVSVLAVSLSGLSAFGYLGNNAGTALTAEPGDGRLRPMRLSSRDPDRLGRWEDRTRIPLLVAALTFLLLLTVPIIDRHLSPLARLTLRAADSAIWALFVLDYVLRLSWSPSRRRFAVTHLPDLAMIILPALRPLRLLRLFTVGNLLARRSATAILGETTRAVAACAVLLTYLGAVVELDSERDAPKANITSFEDALWWACTTITTVGYGDRYPVTTQGRLVAVALMLIGIALLGLLTAGIAAWFVRQATDVTTAAAAQLIVAEVRAAETAETTGQKRLDAELAEILSSLDELNTRLRNVQQRSASQAIMTRQDSAGA